MKAIAEPPLAWLVLPFPFPPSSPRCSPISAAQAAEAALAVSTTPVIPVAGRQNRGVHTPPGAEALDQFWLWSTGAPRLGLLLRDRPQPSPPSPSGFEEPQLDSVYHEHPCTSLYLPQLLKLDLPLCRSPPSLDRQHRPLSPPPAHLGAPPSKVTTPRRHLFRMHGRPPLVSSRPPPTSSSQAISVIRFPSASRFHFDLIQPAPLPSSPMTSCEPSHPELLCANLSVSLSAFCACL